MFARNVAENIRSRLIYHAWYCDLHSYEWSNLILECVTNCLTVAGDTDRHGQTDTKTQQTNECDSNLRHCNIYPCSTDTEIFNLKQPMCHRHTGHMANGLHLSWSGKFWLILRQSHPKSVTIWKDLCDLFWNLEKSKIKC